MARHLIIASHGGLAEGILDTLRLILGDTGDARAWGLTPGHSASELVEELDREIAEHPDETYVLLADLYGASVFTSLCQLLVHPNVHLISGLNVALAIAALTEGEDDFADEWVELARNDVRHVTIRDLENDQNAPEDDF